MPGKQMEPAMKNCLLFFDSDGLFRMILTEMKRPGIQVESICFIIGHPVYALLKRDAGLD